MTSTTIQLDLPGLTKDAQAAANREAKDIVLRSVASYFRVPHNRDDKSGFGYELIKTAVDDAVLNDEFQVEIKRLVAHYMQQYAQEVAREAALRGVRKGAALALKELEG